MLNGISIMGRLVRAPEIRYTRSGIQALFFDGISAREYTRQTGVQLPGFNVFRDDVVVQILEHKVVIG